MLLIALMNNVMSCNNAIVHMHAVVIVQFNSILIGSGSIINFVTIMLHLISELTYH